MAYLEAYSFLGKGQYILTPLFFDVKWIGKAIGEFSRAESPSGQPFEPDLGNASEGKWPKNKEIFQGRFPVSGSGLFIFGLEMHLTVNGEDREFDNNRTVTELLRDLDISGTHIAVAVNLQVVPRADYDTLALNDGDKVEIVHAVGGGC